MKKGLLLLLAGLMVMFGVSGKAMASARIDSMSSDVREIGDIDLIWLYPNMVLDYKNTADFRLNANGLGSAGAFGGGTAEWGGVIVDETTLGGVIGTYVNRPTFMPTAAAFLTNGAIPFVTTGITYFGNPGNMLFDTTPNLVDLFWAKDLSGTSFGLHFNYGDNGIGGTETAQWGLSAGLGFTGVGPFNSLNVHADYGTEAQTNTAIPAPNKDNGISTIKVGALGRADVSDNNYINAFADVQADGNNFKDVAATEYSDLQVSLGAACNHKIDSGKGLLSTGLMINYMGGSVSNTTTNANIAVDSWVLLWNAGLEAQATDWLTLRAGLESELTDRLYVSTGAPKYTSNGAGVPVNFSTGFAVNWQNWTVDADVVAGSLENSIAAVQPGRGIFFAGNIVTVTEADLRYKF